MKLSGSLEEHHHIFQLEEIKGVRTNLLNWYDQNKRDLPWRKLYQVRQVQLL
jgi:adenine-specific DNA glycosylase